MSDYTLEPLRHELVADYVRAHVEMTVLTYAHVMGPGFAANRRAELAEREASVHAEVDEAFAAAASGRLPFRQHVVARNARGGIVGVLAFGDGVETWEADHVGEAWTPPAVTWAVSHLYTAPGTFGTGLGQTLLDLAAPAGAGAYLWVFTENPRALAFYHRNGFVFDGLAGDSGEDWGSSPMARMVRPGEAPASLGALGPVQPCLRASGR